ncbi:MAG: serine hydrolase [Firmicutes bacterium]|nr:serine hydrolase [Bacillota bacterium]
MTREASRHARLAICLGAIAVLLVVFVKVYGHTPAAAPREPQPALPEIDTARLKSEILDAIGSAKGTYGVYFKLLGTSQVVDIRSSEAFFAASCYKMPLVLMLYEMAASGEIDLEEKVEYTREDRELGTGIIVGYRYGSQFSLRKLAELAVVKSDNVAGNMLVRRLGKDRFLEYQTRSGAAVLPVESNVSSPADLGLFAERLWRFSQDGGELGDELLGYFIETEHKDRIAAGLPPQVKVANKIGTWPGSVNDVGIVWDGEINYVLAVMSKDVPSVDAACDVISALSRRVHEYLKANWELPAPRVSN